MTERPTEQLQPKARPQVGAGVSDLERGIRCHQEILGLMRLKGPSGVRVDPQNPRWSQRDRFILSKGHSSIGQYTVMALRGFLPIEELKTFDKGNSRLQGHPDVTKLPGLDTSTGSLGQGLSVGLGMALGARLRGEKFHTFVMIGDGELQEGMIWEALHIAPRYKLGNLTAILDWNGLQ